MFDSSEELKALEDLVDNLRTLFQHEDQLIAEGWYSRLEFLKAVIDVMQDGIEKIQQ